MSNPRFAAMTSDLLARKGDAMPSTLAAKPSLFWRRAVEPATAAPEPVRLAMTSATDLRRAPAPELPVAPPSPPPRDLRRAPEPVPEARPVPPPVRMAADTTPPLPPDVPKPHKMMVTLTSAEYEKLGIAAVKKGLTRHQIVRVALDLHMDRLKREYGGCGCMANGPGNCGEGCGG